MKRFGQAGIGLASRTPFSSVTLSVLLFTLCYLRQSEWGLDDDLAAIVTPPMKQFDEILWLWATCQLSQLWQLLGEISFLHNNAIITFFSRYVVCTHCSLFAFNFINKFFQMIQTRRNLITNDKLKPYVSLY